MSVTLTLISAPANPAVSADLVTHVHSLLKLDTEVVWLMEGVACDFVIKGTPDEAAIRDRIKTGARRPRG